MRINNGIYLWYREIKQKSPSGQIAAVLTIIIAIIFLFIAITINIGKVSQAKTALTVATDGAALSLASILASTGHALSETYLEGGVFKSELNWIAVLGIVAIVVITILTWGTGTLPAMAAFLGAAAPYAIAGLGIMVSASLIGTSNWGQVMSRNMAEMNSEASLPETAIGYAFSLLVDDPELVVDVNDYDEDGRTDDKIPRFIAWYTHRLYWRAKETYTLALEISRFQDYLGGFYLDTKDIRRYISGTNNWPQPPIGGFMQLLQDIEEDHAVTEAEQGIVYDYIPQSSWDLYRTSQNVNDLQLKDRAGRTRYDNLWYDFSFFNEGMNPSNENDPVNDGVDFFLKDLQEFRESCFGDWDPEENPEGARGFANTPADELAIIPQAFYSGLQSWLEDIFSKWDKEIEKWREELLNRNDSLSNGSLLNKIDATIEDLENQIKNDNELYSGGLKTILETRQDLTEDQKQYLNDIIAKMEDSILVLKKIGWEEYSSDNPKDYLKNVYFAAGAIARFRARYADFYAKWKAFKKKYVELTQGTPVSAEYTWQDSLGQHSVKVDVDLHPDPPPANADFTIPPNSKVPTIIGHSKYWGFRKHTHLVNYKGYADVTVTRRDDPQGKEVNLANRLLWIFRSPTITSRVKATYNATSYNPVSLKKW